MSEGRQYRSDGKHSSSSEGEDFVRVGKKEGMSTLETCLALSRPIDGVFAFFADAGNLETITPPWLRFEILTKQPIEIRAGTRIEYRIRLHGIPLRWQSEITVWEPPLRFVDEQRRGPYRRWVHEHAFVESGSGTEMRDFVQYAPIGGKWIDRLFVRRDVKRIFEYRNRVLRQIFS